MQVSAFRRQPRFNIPRQLVTMNGLPKLPPKAAYVCLNNPSRRNALSITILRDLHSQLQKHMTSPNTGQLLTLPPFKPSLLNSLTERSKGSQEYNWLVDASEWRRQRDGLPNVLVLRSSGPVFSSGHDLKELAALSREEVKETFTLCAEVMSLIRRSPAVVVCPVQGLATAAGFQLAMTADIAIALSNTKLQLPGMGIGLPCTSPATAVSRRVLPAVAYRLFATAEPVLAGDLAGAVDVVEGNSVEEFEARVAETVKRLAGMPGQAQALGKWAFWTQLGISGGEGGVLERGWFGLRDVGEAVVEGGSVTGSGDAGVGEYGQGDGYEDAAQWAADAMTLHARSEDAKEGISAFMNKRKPEWKT
jgi:enoyl-CoA hydratase/carnithine racemase